MPGDAVVADDRQHTGHAHADAAGHRLLDRALGGHPVAGRRRRLTARSMPIGPQA